MGVRTALQSTAPSQEQRNNRQAGKTYLANRDAAQTLLQLQRIQGNKAVGQWLQAKLRLGNPGDPYERKADRVADAVMRMPDSQRQADVSQGADHGMVQAQMVTPIAAGVGNGGIMERDREAAFSHVPMPSGYRKVKVWLNTFIPHRFVKDPLGRCFAGDNRGFSNHIHASSRTHQEIEFDVPSLTRSIDWKNIGETHKLDCSTSAILETGRAPASEVTNGKVNWNPSSGTITADFYGNASNPLVTGAPGITFQTRFHVDPLRRQCWVTGEHDGFPGYEAYVTADGGAGVQVYGYNPIPAGASPASLFPMAPDVTMRAAAVGF